MPEGRCPVFAHLEAEAHAVLKHIQELAGKQIEAFENNDLAEFARLDRELELTVGHKERAVGALREHAAEHGCRPPFLVET